MLFSWVCGAQYKASVWATMVDGEQDMLNRQAEEAARLQEQQRRDEGEERTRDGDETYDEDRTAQEGGFKGWGNI